MREIKFRAWGTENELMIYQNNDYYAFCIRESSINVASEDTGDWIKCEIMQYTGLKDKNGKEIYEGDIVEIVYCNSKYMGKVVFNEKTCGFEIWYNSIIGAYGEKATHKINFAMDIEIKVIGNIYDNPENQEVSE